MKHNQNGALNTIILLVISVALFIGATVFAIIQTGNVSKYKNNANQLIASAVVKAKSEQQTTDNANYQKLLGSPYTSYIGPSSFGSITFSYPKNWSGYVDSSNDILNGFFFPGILPSVDDASPTNYALRINVLNSNYSDTLNGYTSNGASVTPYSLPKVTNDVGVQINGKLNNGKTGTLIILPLRNQTLEIWTEGGSYNSEFGQILSSFTFLP